LGYTFRTGIDTGPTSPDMGFQQKSHVSGYDPARFCLSKQALLPRGSPTPSNKDLAQHKFTVIMSQYSVYEQSHVPVIPLCSTTYRNRALINEFPKAAQTH
jgi:hypothetical protein